MYFYLSSVANIALLTGNRTGIPDESIRYTGRSCLAFTTMKYFIYLLIADAFVVHVYKQKYKF